MVRSTALTAAIVASLLAVSGAGGAEEQTPRRGGTVVVAQSADEPACLNPFDADRCRPGTSPFTLRYLFWRVLESSFDVGPDFTWRSRLVSSFTFTRKPPFVLTYHIRPEAQWSDGTRITAADFVFTHRAILRYGEPDDPNRTEVRSVRAIDAKTVRVVLHSRLGSFRGLFGMILPRHALLGEDLATIWTDRIDNPKTGQPIGSGPFLVERWDRGKQITLRRNPRYWGKHPAYLDRLVFRFRVDGNALAAGFRSREFDVAAGFPPGFVPALQRERGVQIRTFPSVNWDHFEIRIGAGGHPALKNKVVRRALAFGIDRGPLVRAAYAGLGAQGKQRDSLVFPTTSRYYRPNWSAYRYRRAEARRLFELAGCRRGADRIYVCAGERLSLRFVTRADPGDSRTRVIELVQAQLLRSGVEVVPQFAPSNAFLNEILTSGAFDVALFAFGPRDPDPGLNGIFTCGGGDFSFTGYCQRSVTRDLDQAERIFDAGQRARVLNRADRQLARDVPAIPLYERPQWAALRSTVRNVAPSPIDVLVNAENWWLDR
jgi:ABC-type transport system substrate-binding protein